MLTLRQEGFTLNLYEGLPEVDAYKNHYNTGNMAINTIYEAASRLAHNSKVIARLVELRLPAVNSTKMLVQEREEKLSEIARDVKGDNIRAIQELNKMDGSYSPEKHLVGVIVTTPEGLLEAQERLLKAQQDTKALLEKFKGRKDG